LAKKKNKPPANRVPKQRSQPESPSTRSSLRKLLSKIWAGIAAAAVVVTLTGLSLLQKISVAATHLLDPQAPFSSPFIISNDGSLPIHDVTFRCVLRNVEDEGHGRVVAPKGITSGHAIIQIDPGEKSTVACPFPFTFRSPLISADIEVVVKYRQDFVFWHSEKPFRFGLAKDKNGQFNWFPRSTSE